MLLELYPVGADFSRIHVWFVVNREAYGESLRLLYNLMCNSKYVIMKKLLFVLVMWMPLMAFSAVEINGLYYELDSYTQTAKVSRDTPGTYYGRVEIIIPSSVTYNGVDYSVTGIGAWAFDNAVNMISLTIPESVTYIEEHAFFNCSSLSSITIPGKVHSIYDNAFESCSKLTSIIIPKSVTYIGNSLFQNCDALESIVVEEGNPKYDSRNNCNAIIEGTRLMVGCKNTIIPNGVNIIWPSAFMYCKGIVSLNIPNGVQEIGSNAFYMCKDLSSITLPIGLETIRRAAFAECYKLESVTIPSGVATIEMYAFGGCRNLKTVTSLLDDPITISDDVFSVEGDAILYVPKGSKSKYAKASGWNKFNTIIEISQKCQKPTISYSNGRLKFECQTEDVEFKSTITNTDIKNYSESEIALSAMYNISVYAAKTGYDNSDIATATLCWLDIEPRTEGMVNDISSVSGSGILVQSSNETISIHGAADGTNINIYTTSGVMVGTAKSKGSSTSIATGLRKGDIAIVKIGDKSVKVIMK